MGESRERKNVQKEYGRSATKMRAYAKVNIIKQREHFFVQQKFFLVIVQKCWALDLWVFWPRFRSKHKYK